jgi:uncharacterized protein (UPF0332 family)
VAGIGPNSLRTRVSPLTNRHFRQARHNRDFAEDLLALHGSSPTHVQWAVTAAFYCAVHCVQGYLVDRGRDPRTHVTRGIEIADPANQVPIDVQRAYEALKQFSEKARYRLGTFDPAYVRTSILDRRLRAVTDFVGL